VRRRPSRSLTSGGRGGSASHSATGRGQPAGMLCGAEVLGQPPPGVGAGELDLTIAVEQRHRRAGRRIVGERADEASARLRGPQRTLEPRAGDVEHVAVALGELALGPPEPGDDRLAATGAHADRDLVLHAGGVQQVAVELAARERAGLNDLRQPQGRAPAGRVRREQRVVARVPHHRREGAGRLRPDRRRLVIDGARGELDSIPGQDVRGNELGERLQRATLQLGLRPGSHDRADEPVRGAHVGVGEPGHGDAFDDTPAARPLLHVPPSPFGCSLAFGFRWSVE
jgi:hypothetical protein